MVFLKFSFRLLAGLKNPAPTTKGKNVAVIMAYTTSTCGQIQRLEDGMKSKKKSGITEIEMPQMKGEHAGSHNNWSDFKEVFISVKTFSTFLSGFQFLTLLFSFCHCDSFAFWSVNSVHLTSLKLGSCIPVGLYCCFLNVIKSNDPVSIPSNQSVH